MIKNKGSSTTFDEVLSLIWPRLWLDDGHRSIGRLPAKEIILRYFKELSDYIIKNEQALFDAVNGQISDRDYRLVNQTQNFVFILTSEIANSEGVKAELSHAKSLRERNTHFFNPDNLELSRKSGGPDWAVGVTGKHAAIEHMVKVLKTHEYTNPYLI